jgi:hypothetical protein
VPHGLLPVLRQQPAEEAEVGRPPDLVQHRNRSSVRPELRHQLARLGSRFQTSSPPVTRFGQIPSYSTFRERSGGRITLLTAIDSKRQAAPAEHDRAHDGRRDHDLERLPLDS